MTLNINSGILIMKADSSFPSACGCLSLPVCKSSRTGAFSLPKQCGQGPLIFKVRGGMKNNTVVSSA